MKTSSVKIYNTISSQEKIVILIVSMLVIGQPFPGIVEAAVCALAAIGLWLIVTERWLRQSVGIWRLGGIVLLLAIPILFSFWNTYSIDRTVNAVVLIPTMFLVGVTLYSCFKNQKLMSILTTVIAIASILCVFDCLIQFAVGVDLLGIPLEPGGRGKIDGRVIGPFARRTHLGILLTVLLPVVIKWLNQYGRFLQFVYLALLAFVIYSTGSRTALVTYLVAIVLFYMWSQRGRVLLIGFILPTVLATGWITASNSSFAKSRLQTFLVKPTSYNDWNKLLSGRLDIWWTGWNMFSEYPITGIGAKAFREAYLEFKPPPSPDRQLRKRKALHAHHPWISILSETGLIGFIGLLGVVVLVFGLTVRSKWGVNLYVYPWLLSFVLILNPLNSMPPIYKSWWLPIVLLVIVSHLVDLEHKRHDLVS